jgi:hypothetical protein
MIHDEPWFVQDRAERRALLLWTTFPVVIGRSTPTRNVDFRVTIDAHTKSPITFGVCVKGVRGLSRFLTPNRALRPEVRRRLLATLRNSNMPVAVMVVDVYALATYVGWLIAPSGDSVPAGVPNRPLKRAAKETLEKMLDQLRDGGSA